MFDVSVDFGDVKEELLHGVCFSWAIELVSHCQELFLAACGIIQINWCSWY